MISHFGFRQTGSGIMSEVPLYQRLVLAVLRTSRRKLFEKLFEFRVYGSVIMVQGEREQERK